MCFDLLLRRCCIGLAVHLRQATKGKGVREDGIHAQLWPSLEHEACSGWAQRLRPASSMDLTQNSNHNHLHSCKADGPEHVHVWRVQVVFVMRIGSCTSPSYFAPANVLHIYLRGDTGFRAGQ